MTDPLNEAIKDAFKGAMHDSAEAAWSGAVLPTGCVPLDRALGGGPDALTGGFGEGRIHEVFGGWSVGKSVLLYMWLIYVQVVLGGKSILFEAEGGFAPKWYAQLGGILDPKNPNTLLYYPDLKTVEDFFEGVSKIITIIKESGFEGPVAIGWDSIAATGTKHLHKQGLDGSRDMTKAFLMDQGTKWIVSELSGTRISVVGVNQSRVNVGAKDWEETHTPGGRAWPYFSSARIELAMDGGPKGSRIVTKDGKQKIGRAVRGEIIKNKMAAPFETFQMPVYTHAGYEHPVFENTLTMVGIDTEEALMNYYLRKPKIGPEKIEVVSGGGGGKYKLHTSITGNEKRTFFRKEWKAVLHEYPQLRQFNPFETKKKGNRRGN